MRRDPDSRWKEVQQYADDGLPPEDPLLLRVYSVMVGDVVDDDVQYAIDKINEPQDRDAIVAYLLSGADPQTIADSLWISRKEVIEIFALLYMDLSTFRDKLEHLRFCEYYLAHVCDPEDHRNKALIQQGISHGPKALELWWKRAGDHVAVAREDITDAVLRMAFTNAMAAKDVSVTSPVAKEAHRWVRTAMDTLEVRDHDKGLDDDSLDALVAIDRQLESTKTPEEAGLNPEEILH